MNVGLPDLPKKVIWENSAFDLDPRPTYGINVDDI